MVVFLYAKDLFWMLSLILGINMGKQGYANGIMTASAKDGIDKLSSNSGLSSYHPLHAKSPGYESTPTSYK